MVGTAFIPSGDAFRAFPWDSTNGMLDLFVEGRVVVECKAKETLHPIDGAQVLSHLRLLKGQVGLLINFHVMDLKVGIKRIVNDYQE